MAYFSNCNANTNETLDYKFNINGIYYNSIQDEENPMWLETVGMDDRESGDILIIPEEITLHLAWDIPAIVEKIGIKSFSHANIKSIQIPSTVTRIEQQAFEFSSLETIQLSEGLIYIGEKAFAENSNLRSIKLPESLLYLGYASFYFCNHLELIDLPSSLKGMGGFTFRFCGGIKDIYCRAEIPPLVHYSDFGVVFNILYPSWECPSGPNVYECILHVPAGSIELYRNAPGWNLFQNIVAIEEDATVEEVNTDDSYEYYVNSHMVTIPCIEGDLINVCNTDGICIHTEEMKNDGDYVFTGRGIYIISRNGKSIKIAL